MINADDKQDIGRGFGCVAMLLLVFVPLFPILIGLSWTEQNELTFGLVIMTLIVVAVLVGKGISQSLNFIALKRNDGGDTVLFRLFAALLTLTVAGLTMVAAYLIWLRSW